MNTKILESWEEAHPGLLVETILIRQSLHSPFDSHSYACGEYITNNPIKLINRIPFLVLSSGDKIHMVPSIYSLGDEKIIHSLQLSDDMKNIKFCGSCHGWLICIGLEGTIRMLEAFTNTHIDLPPLSSFSDIIDYQSNRLQEEYSIRSPVSGDIYNRDKFGVLKIHVNKIILSSPPSQNDFMAIAIYGEIGKLAYTTRNSNNWTDFSTLYPNPKPAAYWDAIFHKGKIYALDVRGFTWEYDIETKVGNITEAPQHFIGCNDRRHEHAMYLVGNNDELLLVVRHIMFWMHQQGENDETKFFYHTCGFDVYKLYKLSKEKFKWLKVKNLGDYMLVIGSNSSRCMSIHTITGVKKNQIYYSDDNLLFQYREDVGGHDIGVFNLKDGTIHSFFPHTPLILPAPIWLF